MASNEIHDFALHLADLAKMIAPNSPAMRKVLDAAGMEGKASAAAAARRDLGGDGKFSGWPKASLEARYSDHRDGLGVTIHRAPRSAGPWRVADQGRNQGNATGFSGPGVNPRTGRTARGARGMVRTVQPRRGRRWNGRTVGKNTWSDAEALMISRIPRVVEAEVDKLMMEWLNGS